MRGRTPEAAADQAPAPTGAAAASPTRSAHLQKFSVAYEFPVVFTSGLFAPGEPGAGRHALPAGAGPAASLHRLRRRGHARRAPDSRRRDPRLRARGTRERMALVADPIAVPGGEKIKIELHFVEQMQRQLFEHRIDRHSYVIADRRRRGARRGRPRRGDHASRRAPHPRADHRAGAERFRRRREERRQPLRAEELRRHLRAALRGAERPRLPRRAAAARQDRRHGRGGEGRADPRRRLLRLARAERRRARRLRARRHGLP